MLLEATTDEAFISSVETNLGGTFRLCRAAVPALRRQAGSAIVNVSSTAARFPTPGLAVYSATKAAVEALTRALAAELAPGVRVNAVSPGPTLTESVRDLMASDTTGAVAAVTKGLPLQRLGEPEEIAEALLFLGVRPCQLHHRPGAARQRRGTDGVTTSPAASPWPSSSPLR